MRFTIERASNGWIFRCVDDEDGGDNGAIVANEESDNEFEAFRYLLWEIINQYGPTSGKYSEKQLLVAIVPGYDYMGQLDLKYREDLTNLRDRLNTVLDRKSAEKDPL